MAIVFYDSSPIIVTVDTAYAVAIVYNHVLKEYQFIVNGSIVDTVSADLSLFTNPTFDTIGDNDYMYSGRLPNGTPVPGKRLNITRERMWQKTLTVSEINAETASVIPIITDNLLSDAHLSSVSDLSDSSGNGYNFSGVQTPTTDGSYVQVSATVNQSIRRSSSFLDFSQDFTIFLIMYRPSPQTTGLGYIEDLRLIGVDTSFGAPYLWMGVNNDASSFAVTIGAPAVGADTNFNTIPKIDCLPTTIVSSPARSSGCNQGGVGWSSQYTLPGTGVMPIGANPIDGESLTNKRISHVWAEVQHVDY